MAATHVSRLTATPHRPPLLITLWMFLSSLVVMWDVMYLTLRPRSMAGGDLVWWWHPYQLYATIDPNVYGWPAFNSKAGFPMAQSALNVVECGLNFFYLYSSHIKKDPASVLVGFAAVIATFSKTALYFAIEGFSGFVGIKHNSLKDLVLFYVLPNGFWIVVPGILIVCFGREIVTALRAAASAETARKHS